MNWLDNNILTLVTFAPAAGGLLLLFFPRRDRDIRVFSLVISLLTFVLSLHLPAHFNRGCLDSNSTRTFSGFPRLTFTTTWHSMEYPCGWWC